MRSRTPPRALRRLLAAIVIAIAGSAGAGLAVPTSAAEADSARTSGATASPSGTKPYARLTPPLSTPWTSSVSVVAPLPEYPRPQLERFRWENLNGEWQYETGQAGERPPSGRTLAQTILVPFSPESPLSGIGRQDSIGWYRRLFRVPAGWHSDHVMLNFGAVSWTSWIYVNGHRAEIHRGDYDSFSLDITHLLRRGENELLVGYWDPMGAVGEPVGKQAPGPPGGISHSPVSGIWQTVWLEPVPARHITALTLIPKLPRSELLATATVTSVTAPGTGGGAPARGARASPAGRVTVLATALAGARAVATASGAPGQALALHIPHPHDWSPWDPYLYGLRMEVLERGRIIDTVSSYFGMRSITLGRVGGAVRILLNGRFVFETGALDQGYWPDGLYTPPSDAAIRSDVDAAKRLGYDMLREHQKVQPDRWYYWAARLGVLVWQDMPAVSPSSAADLSAAGEAEFRRELARIVVQHASDPSIVVWIPFNEGRGQFDPGGITQEVKSLAPGTLVDADSGSANCCGAPESPNSDIRDTHLYSGPFAGSADYRASVVGEYGGVLPYPPQGHRWPGLLTTVGAPAHQWPPSPPADLLGAEYAAMAQEMRVDGLSAAVFTELADYEQELGILTYDREVFTLPPSLVHSLNASLIAASRRVGSLAPQPAHMASRASGIWTFAEGTGSTAADSTPADQSLTLQGGASWTRGPVLRGVATRALSITGSGQSAVTASPVIDTSRSFTISVWLKPAAYGQSGTAVSEPGPDGSSFSLGIDTASRGPQSLNGQLAEHKHPPLGTATWWTFAVPADSTCTSAQCGVRASLHYDDGRDPPRPGHWYQLTAVYDTHAQAIALYVDGRTQDIEHIYGVPPGQGSLAVGGGVGNYRPDDTFLGAIGQLRTYSRALSPADIWELYRAQVG